MKLKDVPEPLWYALLAVVAAGGVWWLSKKAAGAVGDAVKGAGQAAYNAGDAVQDALVPGVGTLGTLTYDVVQGVKDFFQLPSDYSFGDGTYKPHAVQLGSWSENYPVANPAAGEPRRPGVNVPRFSKPY